MVSDEGRTLVAIARLRVGGVYYPDLDRSFGNGGIAVVGMEAAFALFSEQADGSLMLSHGAYAGGPLQGGDAVIKLLGTNLPSPGLIFLEAPPIPVPVVQGTPVIVSARRALGSSGAMTVSYAVTAQSNGPPISFSLVRDVTLTWGDGEQGSRSAEAATAQGAVGHYYVDAKSAPETAFFDNKGSFEVVLSSPSSTGNPGSGSPIGGASGANGTQSAGGAPRSGGGSLDRNLLMFLACLLQQIAQSIIKHSQHQRRSAQQRTAREVLMWNPREHVKALRGAGNGLGHQLAGKARQGDAVPGKSLQVVHIRLEATEVRRPVHSDVHIAAPGVLDARLA
jgi:hypothetical protein